MSNLYCKEIRKKSIKRVKKNSPHRIRMNDKDDSAWVFDSLIGFLQGPIWSTPLITFIEEKSLSKLKYLCNELFYIIYINIYFFLKTFLKILLKMTLFLLILNLWKITRKDVTILFKHRTKNESFNFSKALSYTLNRFFFVLFFHSIRSGCRGKWWVSKDISGVQKSGGFIAWLFYGRHGNHSGTIRVRLYRK